jgi:NAD(P)-dependent dehydrogenase (short-subunit alcohol dehydrogenase family)
MGSLNFRLSTHYSTMSKTIIITGANGNLGTAVINRFLRQGYKIVATVSSAESCKEQPQAENI